MGTYLVRNNSQLLYITAKRQKIRVLPYWQGSQYHTTAVERNSSTFSLEIKKQMDLIEMGVYFLKKEEKQQLLLCYNKSTI